MPFNKANTFIKFSTTPVSYVTSGVHFKPISVHKNQRKNNKLNKVSNLNWRVKYFS